MTKMRIVSIGATLFALVLTSSIAGADKNRDHQRDFCGALRALNDDATALNALGPDSTVRDVKAIAVKVRKDAKSIHDAAGKLSSPGAKQFTESTDQLISDTHNIPENMRVSQVVSRIRDDIRNLQMSAHELASESGCPEAIPPRDTGGGASESEGGVNR